MYGWIHKCLKETIVNLCGEEKWREICAKSGVEDREGMLEKTSYNDDSEYFAIIKATLELLPHVSEEDLYNMYGDYFMSYIRKNGYEHYLRTFGDSLFEVINNVNKMHGDLATSMSKMKMPDIHCEECEGEDCFLLYYSSPRGSHLKGMLLGIVRALGRTYFGVEVTLVKLNEDSNAEVWIWKVYENAVALTKSSQENAFKSLSVRQNKCLPYAIEADQFHLLSPCHIVFNDRFEILQVSDSMIHSISPEMRNEYYGHNLWDKFGCGSESVGDLSSMNWETFRKAVYPLVRQNSLILNSIPSHNEKSCSYIGKIIYLSGSQENTSNAAVFLASPNVNSLEEMHEQDVSANDLRQSDPCRLRMLQNEAHLRYFKDTSTEAERKLYMAKEKALEANSALDSKRRLMMYISHEIRTPLSIAKFGFELMKVQLEKLEDLIVSVESSINHQSSGDRTSPENALSNEKRGVSFFSRASNVKISPVVNDVPALSTSRRASHEPCQILKKEMSCISHEIRALTLESDHSTQVAITILNDLLSYEKLQSGMLDMSKTLESCPLIEEVTNEFSIEAEYFGLNLKFASSIDKEDRKKILLHVDKPKICQVIRNFVSNALKFTPKGGLVTVNMECKEIKEEDAQSLCIDEESYVQCGVLHVGVLDTGVGIAKENHSKVFHEMTQFSANELQGGGGTGLGLYLTRAIVEKHSGVVGFESEGIGHGCLFYFELPVYRVQRGFPAADDTEKSRSVTSSRISVSNHFNFDSVFYDRTVLICDDSDLSRKMLRKILLSKNCKNVFEAKNGHEAVQMLQQRIKSASACSRADVLPLYDCIFMDDSMPVLPGHQATRQIRRLGFEGLIIGVTGNVTDEDTAQFVAAGADAVFHKPINFSKLNKFLFQNLSRTADICD